MISSPGRVCLIGLASGPMPGALLDDLVSGNAEVVLL